MILLTLFENQTPIESMPHPTKAWPYCWRQLIFRNRREFLQTSPSCATIAAAPIHPKFDSRLFDHPQFQDKLVEVWRMLAARYRGNPNIWAYHAFREWDGWSVEHGPNPQDHTRSKDRTDREQLLRSAFAKNHSPGSPTPAMSE